MTPLASSEVYQIIRGYFSPLLSDSRLFKFQVLVADNSYFSAPDAKDIQTIINSDPVLLPQRYRRDIFDCDDYAIYLKTKMNLIAANTTGQTRPFAFGYIITSNHAYNFGIGHSKEIYVINTQSDNRYYLYPESISQLSQFLELNTQNPIKSIFI